MTPTVYLLDRSYRGFILGYAVGLHGYIPAWMSSLEDRWHESCVYADDFDDIERLAIQCIDFNYKKDAAESDLERRLTIEEMKQL